MAQRVVFFIDNNNKYQQKKVDFQWFPGFAKKQAQKSVASLHKIFLEKYPTAKILEVSTAAKEKLGLKLSAFNLQVKTTKGSYSVEQLFQSGKVFEKHGSQNALLHTPSAQAKKEIKKLNKNDKLVGFQEFGVDFPLTPSTYFYNWIYLKGIQQNKELAEQLLKYDAFTDIYFNPQKSINCQAEACSIYISLFKRNLLKDALKDRKSFLKVVYGNQNETKKRNSDGPIYEQLELL